MKSLVLTISIVLATLAIIGANGEKSTNMKDVSYAGMCGYVFQDGGRIDLHTLDTPYTYTDNIYTFKYSPCDTTYCNGDQAGVCRRRLGSGEETVIGYASSLAINYNGELNITYFGNNNMKSTVTCKCSSYENFGFMGEYPANNFNFNLYSKCCCPDQCKGDTLGGFKAGLFVSFGVMIGTYIIVSFWMAKRAKRAGIAQPTNYGTIPANQPYQQ